MKLLFGDSAARAVSGRIADPVASVTVMKQTPANRRVDGQIFVCLDSDTRWVWRDSASCTGDDVLACRPNDLPTTGRFMRETGFTLLRIPFYATTPSGTNLLTVPSGSFLQPLNFGVAVSRIFTGPASAVVGLSSSNHPGHTGAFNLIGSCGGTQLNNYFSATAAGTGVDFLMAPIALPGGLVASGVREQPVTPWMKGGDTFRHDVGSGFGTGIGEWLVAAQILRNPGF